MKVPDNERQNEFGLGLENLENLEICGRSNLFSNRKRKTKRFKRMGNGLFRYQKSGVIYGVFKAQGQTVWKNLNATERDQAGLLMAEEVRKSKKVNLKASHKTTLDELLVS